MATLAVFLVVAGGGAYAAKKLKLKNNSVTTPKIRNGAVTGPKLADGAVSGGKIADGAVTAAKLAPGAVPTAQIPDGSVTTGDLADGAVTAGKTNFALNSGRVASNPALNQTLNPTLVSAGGVTVTGSCAESNMGHSALISITGPATTQVTGVYVDSGAPGSFISNTPATVNGTLGPDPFAALHRSATMTIITPGNALHLSVFEGINFQGSDCAFSAAGFFG
jgi:hypothetical protein